MDINGGISTMLNKFNRKFDGLFNMGWGNKKWGQRDMLHANCVNKGINLLGVGKCRWYLFKVPWEWN